MFRKLFQFIRLSPLKNTHLSFLLWQSSQLTANNLDKIMGDQYSSLLTIDVLMTLNHASLLDKDNLNAVMGCQNQDRIWRIAEALTSLNEAKILDQANLNALMSHETPRNLAKAFISLHRAELLTPGNRNLVIGYPNIWGLAEALTSLN